MKEKIKTQVLIMGGGAGGCGAALEYIKTMNRKKANTTPSKSSTKKTNKSSKTHRIMIVEKKELLSGTSNITPGRAGFGFHYKHPPTAKMYLIVTLNLVLKYQTDMVGGKVPFSHHLKRGRYFITKDSHETKDNLLALYEELRKEYAEFVTKNPKIKEIFGPPKDFFRILDPSEYENDVNMDNVEFGIETAEQLLDWPLFKARIRKEIYTLGIEVKENCEVKGIEYHKAGKKFIVSTEKYEIHASLVINATWQNIERLNKKLNFFMEEKYRTNRLKALSEVKLPDSLKNMHSMFFCMGPHCMISNMGNSIALMSYAPETNIEVSTDIELPEKSERYLSGKMTMEEKRELGNKIIEGAAKYVPEIKNAQLLSVRTGIVKTLGEVDIFSHDSKVNERDYSGIEQHQIGFISNACMKLLYIFENGSQIAHLITTHLDFKNSLYEEIDKNFLNWELKKGKLYNKILKSVFIILTHRYLTINQRDTIPIHISTMFKTARAKATLLKGVNIDSREKGGILPGRGPKK